MSFRNISLLHIKLSEDNKSSRFGVTSVKVIDYLCPFNSCDEHTQYSDHEANILKRVANEK